MKKGNIQKVKRLRAKMNLNKNDPEDVSMSRVIIQHFHAPYYYEFKEN